MARCPTWACASLTPGPTAATTPHGSCPAMTGSPRLRMPMAAVPPLARYVCRSLPHMPEAFISKTTSPGPGVGSGKSRSSKRLSPRNTTPRITPPLMVKAIRRVKRHEAYSDHTATPAPNTTAFHTRRAQRAARSCGALEQQLPDLANKVAAHAGKRGIVSYHQSEHVAYLIPQRVVNVRGCKGFAEYVQLVERLPALSQKLRAIQAVELLSSLIEALCCIVSRPNRNLLKHSIGIPDKMCFWIVGIGVEEVAALSLAEGLEFHP